MQYWARLLLLPFLVSLVPVQAGEKIGNGGDIRRFRTRAVATRVFGSLGAFQRLMRDFENECGDLVDPETRSLYFDSVGRPGSLFQRFEWEDRETDRACATTWVDDGPFRNVNVRFSYQFCPLGAGPEYYRDIFLEGFRKIAAPEESLSTVIRRFKKAERAVSGCQARGHEVETADSPDSRVFDPIEKSDWAIPGVHEEKLQKATRLILQRVARISDTDLTDWVFDRGIPLRPIPRQADLARAAQVRVKLDSELNSCAYTTRMPGATIRFSARICAEVRNTGEYAWVLAHELGHQFGLESEWDADAFAYLLLDLSPANRAFSW